MKSQLNLEKNVMEKVKQCISKPLPSHQKGSMPKESWVTWANNLKLQMGTTIRERSFWPQRRPFLVKLATRNKMSEIITGWSKQDSLSVLQRSEATFIKTLKMCFLWPSRLISKNLSGINQTSTQNLCIRVHRASALAKSPQIFSISHTRWLQSEEKNTPRIFWDKCG